MKYYDKVIADAFEKSKSAAITSCNGYKFGEINMSSISTKLIQETGRFCERFADDLFIDIDRLKYLGQSMDTVKNEVAAYVAFGIRRDGVDSNSYIALRIRDGGAYKAYNVINDYYRRVYCVKVSRVRNQSGTLETVLELKDIQSELTYNPDYDTCLESEVPGTWS